MMLRRQKAGRGGYSATAGLHFDDQEFESRIVWMWSPPRSGSTWLLQMLAHPLSPWTKGVGNVLGFVTPESWQGTVDAIPVLTTYVANHLLPTAGAENYSEDLVPRHLQLGARPAEPRQLLLLVQVRGRLASRGASHDAGPLSPDRRANRGAL